MIAAFQMKRLDVVVVFETQLSFAVQHDHSFVFVLVVPKPFRTGVTVGDDAFNADVVIARYGFRQLIGKGFGQVRKEVPSFHFSTFTLFRPCLTQPLKEVVYVLL